MQLLNINNINIHITYFNATTIMHFDAGKVFTGVF
jgi:hypothetical protein